MPTIWEEFGIAVAKARAAKGWPQKTLAFEAFGNADRKGYVSEIEKGRSRIKALTIGKLALALDLPDTVTNPLYRAELPEEDVVTKADRDAERLMRVVQADGAVTPPSEALLISLAYEFARGSHLDLMTAYNGLKAALADAADLKARGMLPQNTGDQVQAVLRRVAELNDQGLREEAATEVDSAIADLDALHTAQKSALVEIAVSQDRIRNNPEAAAKRLIGLLKSEAHAGGLFRATRELGHEWHERGDTRGVSFDLEVALHIARQNLSRANRPQRCAALSDFGVCLIDLGQREGRDIRLKQAVKICREVLAETSRKNDRQNWARAQSNLGIALEALGEREGNSENLTAAIAAHAKALEERHRNREPMDWATSQNNLGGALQILGKRNSDSTMLTAAITALSGALEERKRDLVPMLWAMTQNNLGTALTALWSLQSDPIRLHDAITAHRAALQECSRELVPMNWAGTQNNLGLALRILGNLTDDTAVLDQAGAAYAATLLEWTRDRAPFDWAKTQWNLADLDLIYFTKTADPARLTSARAHALAAREVFAEAPAEHQLARCDDLLARIDAAAA